MGAHLITWGRAGHEAQDCVFEANLHIEEAQCEEKPLFLLLPDYRELFDFITQEIVWGLAEWWGVHKGIIILLSTFCQDLTSIFKLNGHCGKPWKRTNPLAKWGAHSL